MPVSLDQFVQQIVAGGLMSADEVAAVVDALPGDKQLRDAEQLARELVRQKKLTAYQAKEAYSGRGKSLVLGNYVVLDKLGQGGMGLVLKAEHRRMERLVALKVLSPKVVRTPEALQRFQREVKAAARLAHPNIVMAFDADEAGGTHFLVMEYVEGSDLASVVKRRGPLSPEQAVDCIRQAAAGLQYAHEHGVIHRDIKPANLLLESVQLKSDDRSSQSPGRVKVLDMGLARLDAGAGRQDELTGTNQIMGTVDYMAPEQAVSTKRADARADIYSLGVTFWYLLTGQPMYRGETAVEKLMAHQTHSIPSLCAACAEASAALEAVFCRMVAKAPQDRYQTMAELIAALEPFRPGTAAAAVIAHSAVAEDSKLDEFLRGLGASALRKQSAAAARATKAATIPVAADPASTVDWSGPHLGTDPKTEQSLPAGRFTSPVASRSRRRPVPPWWHDWRKLAAAGAGGVLLILLGAWVIVRDQEGKEVARVPLPQGGSVTVETVAQSGVGQPASRPRRKEPAQASSAIQPLPPWDLPAGSPPPAIAPFDAATARRHQQAWADHLGLPVEWEVELSGGETLTMVLIPPGEFLMGSSAEEQACFLEGATAHNDQWANVRIPSEGPQHRVRITRAFALSRHEVTRGLFRRVVEETGYKTDAERDGKGGYGYLDGKNIQDPRFIWSTDPGFPQTDDHPVVNVSWNDAARFCQWLSKKQGTEFHLPTEAQWEYACRAGTTTAWHFGDSDTTLGDVAWFGVNSGRKTHSVGQLRPNGFGLHDMHGNVREWCADWYSRDYYVQSLLNDPSGPTTGSDHVIRGGDWLYPARSCRSANRASFAPEARCSYMGFRLASATVDASGRQSAGPPIPPEKQAAEASPVTEPPPSWGC